jgi:hypothetical protein
MSPVDNYTVIVSCIRLEFESAIPGKADLASKLELISISDIQVDARWGSQVRLHDRQLA